MLAERLDFRLEGERDYQTVAGLVLAELRHIPTVGESFQAHGYRFEVVDMDGRKIDKLIVAPVRLPD
jgi:putative hemolysin